MVRQSLTAVALLAIAAPAAAQDAHVWTSKRPDGAAPAGVLGARTLAAGEIELGYRYVQINSKGVWFLNDSLTLEETLEFYDESPVSLVNQTHRFTAAYGITNLLTARASIDYTQREREQITADGIFYVTGADDVGDLEVELLYNFIDDGMYRAHLHAGVLAPTGSDRPTGETPFSTPLRERLPYDMRSGGGTWAAMPGATVQAQNDVATVGAQARAQIRFGENSFGYSLGNRYEATVWGSYMLNDYFALSVRLAWQRWAAIDGEDPLLDPLRDPGNDAFFLEGERLDIPIGLNFYMPEGTRFAGHRLAFEVVYPTHQEYEGPQLGFDFGVNLGYSVAFTGLGIF